MLKIIGWILVIFVVSFVIATFDAILNMIWPMFKTFWLSPGGSQFRMVFSTIFCTLFIVVPIYKGLAWISGR